MLSSALDEPRARAGSLSGLPDALEAALEQRSGAADLRARKANPRPITEPMVVGARIRPVAAPERCSRAASRASGSPLRLPARARGSSSADDSIGQQCHLGGHRFGGRHAYLGTGLAGQHSLGCLRQRRLLVVGQWQPSRRPVGEPRAHRQPRPRPGPIVRHRSRPSDRGAARDRTTSGQTARQATLACRLADFEQVATIDRRVVRAAPRHEPRSPTAGVPESPWQLGAPHPVVGPARARPQPAARQFRQSNTWSSDWLTRRSRLESASCAASSHDPGQPDRLTTNRDSAFVRSAEQGGRRARGHI